jgi:hypothetical protein
MTTNTYWVKIKWIFVYPRPQPSTTISKSGILVLKVRVYTNNGAGTSKFILYIRSSDLTTTYNYSALQNLETKD